MKIIENMVLATLAIPLSLTFVTTAHATVVVANSFSTEAGGAGLAVSSTDLVNQGQASFLNYTEGSPNFGTGNANDGVATNATAAATWYKDDRLPAILTFNLDVSTNTFGYDIIRIDSFAGWEGSASGRAYGNQNFSVEYRVVGSADFTVLTAVDYSPFTDKTSAPGYTQSTITESTSGVLASGVDAVRFVFSAPTTSFDGYGTVIQEIDIAGRASEVDLKLTGFVYNDLDGSAAVTIEGAPLSHYKLVEAADLDFANPDQDPMLLTGATVGTLEGDGILTNSTGDATVQFNLGTTTSATFFRAESLVVESPERPLLAAVRSGQARKVVMIGTSLTHGEPWVPEMEVWLKSESPNPNLVTVVNLGIGGSNSKTGGIDRLNAVKAENPDTVFMEFSMNDAYLPYGISRQQSRDNYNFIINSLKAFDPDIEIIVQTMNNPIGVHLTNRPDIENYYQVARDVAAGNGLLLIDHYPNWISLFNSDPTTWNSYVPDGIHPNGTGQENVLTPVLKAALESAP